MIPIILQHVRELIDAHLGGVEQSRYKIVTPFPPHGQDSPDFSQDALEFNQPPREGHSASEDTIKAYEFFKRTDHLYYDYSYGIKSDEYLFSHVCNRFFLNGVPDGTDANFHTTFTDKRDAFLNRYVRSTAGDLGRFDFRYTSMSPISWMKISVNAQEAVRLHAKAIAVYEDLDEVPFVKALIDEIRSTSYSAVEYELGFFEVIREWIDPRLFEGKWEFNTGGRVLYGESDPFFESNIDVKLCVPERFYVVRKWSGTPTSGRPPEVRGHHGGAVTRREMHRDGALNARRRAVRNQLIGRKLEELAVTRVSFPVATVLVAAPPPRPGFVWVLARGDVPGHWERERAGSPAIVSPPPVDNTTFKVAALKCRVLPRTP